MGAPRPAASPFLAHDHCARYGCERSPSRQAKRSISLSAVVVEPTSRSGTQSDWEKDRVCAVRGGAPPVLSVYSA